MYRVDKLQVSSFAPPNRVLDLYLFINPIGYECYKFEQEINRFITEAPCKINYKILPYHNINTMTEYMHRLGIKNGDFNYRNQLYLTVYQVSLAYKAAMMQGCKRGRKFLFALQRALHQDKMPISEELVFRTADKEGLDLAEFKEDHYSQLTKDAYTADQHVAQEMGITSTPSLVIFDNLSEDYGIMVQNEITTAALLNLVKPKNKPRSTNCKKKHHTHCDHMHAVKWQRHSNES